MATEVSLKLLADIREASTSIKSFTDKANDQVATVSRSFKLLAATAIAALGGISFKKIVDSGIEAEDSVNKLNTALKLSGDYSAKASQDFQNFASQIQATTKFTDDSVISNIALAKSYGLTNDKAKNLVKAATELATVQGIDLQSATQQLAKTYDGTAGKLNETIPALRNLTAAQLKAGAAADIINKQFGGAAESAGNTFSGALEKAKNSFGEILEKIGAVITQNPVLIFLINSAAQAFNTFASYIEKNQQGIANFINNGIVLLVKAFAIVTESLSAVITLFRILNNALNSGVVFILKVVTGLLSFESVGTVFAVFGKTIGKVLEGVLTLFDVLLKLPGVGSAIDELGGNSKGLLETINKLKDGTVKWTDELKSDSAANGMQSILETFQTITEAQDNALSGIKNGLDSTTESAKKLVDKLNEIKGGKLKPLGDSNLQNSTKTEIGLSKDTIDFLKAQSTNLFKGAEGAKNLLVAGVSKISETLLPGFGALIGEFFGFLAQGPEKVREMVTAFIQSIPAILENVILSIPVLIQSIIDNIPVLIDKFIEAIPRIIDALIAQLPRIAISLATMMPMVSTKLALEMPKVAVTFATSLVANIPTIVKGFVDEIKNQIKSVGGLFGGQGGGGGVLDTVKTFATGGLSKIFKFAEGGYVPGFGNGDTVPSLLTPGELVIDRSSAKDLAGFLESQKSGAISSDALEKLTTVLNKSGGSQTMQINLVIGEKQLADVILNLNRNGFRTS